MYNYPVKLNLRLDWSEMDLFGHINNVAYFKYIQASRVNYWETIGLTQLHSNMQIGPILASTSCNFKKPLIYPGNITVEASVSFIKTTSFGIEHRILNAEGEVAATAQDVVVLYNFETNEKQAVPDSIRQQMEQLEGRQL
jgi:acyl-CoA thioester hydrolase